MSHLEVPRTAGFPTSLHVTAHDEAFLPIISITCDLNEWEVLLAQRTPEKAIIRNIPEMMAHQASPAKIRRLQMSKNVNHNLVR